MIHVERTTTPPIFQSKEWQLEKKRAADFFSKQSTAGRLQHHFVFKFHKHSEARETLEDPVSRQMRFLRDKLFGCLADGCRELPSQGWRSIFVLKPPKH